MQLSSQNHHKTNRIDASADLNYKLEKFIEAKICCFTSLKLIVVWKLFRRKIWLKKLQIKLEIFIQNKSVNERNIEEISRLICRIASPGRSEIC